MICVWYTQMGVQTRIRANSSSCMQLNKNINSIKKKSENCQLQKIHMKLRERNMTSSSTKQNRKSIISPNWLEVISSISWIFFSINIVYLLFNFFFLNLAGLKGFPQGREHCTICTIWHRNIRYPLGQNRRGCERCQLCHFCYYKE